MYFLYTLNIKQPLVSLHVKMEQLVPVVTIVIVILVGQIGGVTQVIEIIFFIIADLN